MTTSNLRRVQALEQPNRRDCFACELARLTVGPMRACTHPADRPLHVELAELDRILALAAPIERATL